MTPRTLSTDNAISHAPYDEEEALLNRGFSYVAGIDEVGRGPLAGPVVAGVVILPPRPQGTWLNGIRDSKAITAAQRDRSYDAILENAWASATGQASALEIDEIGIVPATALAMRRALDSLALMPQFLLIDAFPLPDIDIPQKAIVKGDALCLSIAAASIIAKVTRDRIMAEFDRAFPEYGFAGHKGYGSAEHIRRIETLGPCPVHRYSFAPIRHSGHSR
ncbi:MAG: ribonuclease HII [Chloroflexota bacterium]|nr:ribonuclease HII [Chloroflexota bacterium]